jgi:hypothetical protein
LSFGRAIHSRIIFRRASCSGFVPNILWSRRWPTVIAHRNTLLCCEQPRWLSLPRTSSRCDCCPQRSKSFAIDARSLLVKAAAIAVRAACASLLPLVCHNLVRLGRRHSLPTTVIGFRQHPFEFI